MKFTLSYLNIVFFYNFNSSFLIISHIFFESKIKNVLLIYNLTIIIKLKLYI